MPAFTTILSLALLAACGWLLASRRRLAADVERLTGFMDHGPFLAFMKDADGRYVHENRRLVEHIARIRPGTTSLLGRTDRDLFPRAEEQSYVGNDGRVIDLRRPLQFDEISVDADGTVRHWSTVKFPRLDASGRPGIAGIAIDVTDARQARSDARSSEDRCAMAIEAGRMGTFTLDLGTQTLDTSPLFAVLHGRPETKTRLGLEESLAEVHAEDRPKILAAVQAALRDRAPNRIAYRVTAPDGAVRWIELVGRVFSDEAGRPTVVRGVGFDVTEQQSAYEEIARRKQMLRRLIDVQENERQLLCHELHDGLIQYAIGAKMLLESARDEVDDALRTERIDSALDCLERGIAEGRQVIRGVRPAVLDDLGLSAAIVDLADQLGSAGIAVETTLGAGIDAVPPALCTTVYRVVQESLTNVRKYAGTDRATLAIQRFPAAIHLEVCDAGAGFDLDKARRRGFGLVGMTERVRLAGGTIEIETRPNAGCRVAARLPIPDEAEPSAAGSDASADLGAAGGWRPNAAPSPALPRVARA
jgi:PAS domain S-box-containing protein